MNVPDALTRKIGPLPAGAWILALVGGIGVAVVIRRGATDSGQYAEGYEEGEQAGYESVASDWTNGPSATEPGAGNLAGTPGPQGNTGETGMTGPGVRRVANTAARRAWRDRAVAAVVAKGRKRENAIHVLDRYLAGKTLAVSGQRLVAQAKSLVGPPPPAYVIVNVPATAAPSTRDTGTNTNPAR